MSKKSSESRLSLNNKELEVLFEVVVSYCQYGGYGW